MFTSCHCHGWKGHNAHAASHQHANIAGHVLAEGLNQDAGSFDTPNATLNATKTQPEPVPHQAAALSLSSDDLFFGSRQDGEPQTRWRNDNSMELDPLGSATMASPGRSQKPAGIGLNYYLGHEQAPTDHQNTLMVICSRLERLDAAIAKTRLNVVNVELVIKSLSQELFQARQEREQTAMAIARLRNGLDKFMCHVASRLDEDEHVAMTAENADQPETM